MSRDRASIVIADDHAFTLAGLQRALEQTGRVEVVGTAANGIAAIAQIKTHRPDCAILDQAMPGATGLEGDAIRKLLIEEFDIQINKTSRNTVLFMTNIGTTRSSVAYLIEVLVEIAKELNDRLDDASKMERRGFERRVASLVEHVPPLPDFSKFHDVFRAGPDTPEGDIRSAFFLAYDEDNCDYLDLDDALMKRLEAGEELVSAGFIIPYPPGFPILVPGQVISPEILCFMRALDVSEIHGFRPDLGLRVFTRDALKQQGA